MTADSPKSIVTSARSFFSGTMASRITGMLRDIAMAFAFGTEPIVAAFFVAFRLAHILRRLLGEGAMQTAFIPHFEKLKSQCQQKASQFFVDLYSSLTIVLFCCIGITAATLGHLIWHGLLSKENTEIAYYSLLMSPSLLFICLFGLNASLLQCERYFFIPSFAPIAFNLIWIFSVLLMQKNTLSHAMEQLSLTVFFACFCQWLMTVPKTVTILKNLSPSNTFGKISPFSKDVKELCNPLLLGITGVAAVQLNSGIDLFFARYADLQGPAFLWYAIRLEQLPLSLLGIAFATALLPALSRAIKEKDQARYTHLIETTSKKAVSMLIPLTAGIFTLGYSGVNLLYGHGDFGNHSVGQTTLCLYGYGLGLLAQGLVLLQAPAFYAAGNYATPTIASLVSVSVSIALNALMVFGFHWGAVSIALATSAASWINFAILAVALKNMVTAPIFAAYKNGFRKIWAATLVASLAVVFVDFAFFGPKREVSFPWQLLHFFSLATVFACPFATFLPKAFLNFRATKALKP